MDVGEEAYDAFGYECDIVAGGCVYYGAVTGAVERDWSSIEDADVAMYCS